MAKLVIVLAFIGIAYWYWSGPYQNSLNAPPVDDTRQNARIMEQCIARVNYAEAVSGSSGNVGSTGNDAEEVCADENRLFKMEGNWYRR